MKLLHIGILPLSMIVFAASCASPRANHLPRSPLLLTQADRGKTFEVGIDDMVVIRLPENPSTGFRWAVEQADEGLLVLHSSEYSPDPGGDASEAAAC